MSTRLRTPLRTSWAILAGTALVATALTSCAARSLASEANALADELRKLPGVTQVSMTYTDPITLDSGKLDLKVTMDEAAPTDEIVEVVSHTYAAFSSTHNAEEGDLDVALGPHVLHLRSFSSDAETDAVADAAQRAATVVDDLRTDGPDPTVRVDLMTQDVEQAPHVDTDITVTLAETGRDAVLDEVTAAQKAYPEFTDVGWRIASGGRTDLSSRAVWELGSTTTFPSATARKLFIDLSTDLPRDSTVSIIDDFSSVTLPRTAADQAVALSESHVRLLGGHADAYYDLQIDGTPVFSVMNGECWFDTGTVGTALDEAHADQCTTVIAP